MAVFKRTEQYKSQGAHIAWLWMVCYVHVAYVHMAIQRTSLNWELQWKTMANTTELQENLWRVKTCMIGLAADTGQIQTWQAKHIT